MKKWMILPAMGAVVLALQPAAVFANRGWVTCTGIMVQVMVEVDMSDVPTAVIYDSGKDSTDTHSCVVELGPAGQWPLQGSCHNGERCTVSGRYAEKINNVYYLRDTDRIERNSSYRRSDNWQNEQAE